MPFCVLKVIHEEALSSVVFLIGGSMALSDGVQVTIITYGTQYQ